MGEVGAVPFLPFRQGFLFSSSSRRGTGAKERVGKRWQRVVVTANSHHLQRQQNPSTFSSTISTDIPLSESPPGASFDEYLSNRARVFQAMFPDKHRSQRLNNEEWRIQMLPLDFLFLSVRPVIDMRLRCKSEGKDYPPGVPPRVTRVLELQAIKWELQGLENVLKPSHFALCVKGALYSDRRGIHSRLRGQLEMSISCILPPALSLIPEDVLKGVSESVLRRLVERMKQKVNESLLSDFREFRRESLKIQGRR
ncbi:uncharacterized protein LOC131230819 isoform X2 [Magnolia sinica]|uniref:uncharacterized protein LOC131230819 isoform X2 n=1 Tax=Magnolia sinica TaxID=86752 RepID=UPI00265A7804|nr:uncharacterized protein LOC131230819 isoform X2 [Magnolia sinica]